MQHLNAFQARIAFSEIDETLIAVQELLGNLKGRKGKMDPSIIKSYFDKLKVVQLGNVPNAKFYQQDLVRRR